MYAALRGGEAAIFVEAPALATALPPGRLVLDAPLERAPAAPAPCHEPCMLELVERVADMPRGQEAAAGEVDRAEWALGRVKLTEHELCDPAAGRAIERTEVHAEKIAAGGPPPAVSAALVPRLGLSKAPD
jgi:hypothetical protein